MTNALTNPGAPGLPATPDDLAAFYARAGEAYAQSESRGGSSISLRNGIMSIGDQVVPGNQLAVVILDFVRLNTFYATAFNPTIIAPPTCYAVGRSDAEMAPHPAMAQAPAYFHAQAERCLGCPKNEYSSGLTGKGKACSNRRRMLMLFAGSYTPGAPGQGMVLHPETSAEHYATAPLLGFSLAPTSIGNLAELVKTSAAQYNRPPFGVFTRMFSYMHPKHSKEAVGFEIIAPVTDDLGMILAQRRVEAMQVIGEGYSAPEVAAR